MELTHPFRVVTASVDGDVLAVLAGADAAFTAPQIQSLMGMRSAEGVRKSVRRLASQGIVTAERVGQAWVYRLNRDHLAAPHVTALADLRRTLLERIADEVDHWSPAAELVLLFGSAATGTMRADSDIDLFVARPDAVDVDHPAWNRQVHLLQDHVTTWTGNDARVLELSLTETLDEFASGSRVLADIAEHGIGLGGRARSLRALQATVA